MSEFGKQASGAELDTLCVNTIRTLAMDGVQAANSGHPGMPMGTAAMGHAIWSRFLKHNPADPTWANRDRFVLSAGHGSMLLYSLLHMTGYDLPLEELKNFRQWGSKTPGHPELGATVGVETTTGPLGQGAASGVGMALAAQMAAARFNTEKYLLINHHVYAILGDGCQMEGLTSEAASFAGHLKLGNLIYLYDDNEITIEGSTSLAFSEDVGARYEAYGWQVLRCDGLDVDAVSACLEDGKAETEKPTMIICKGLMGAGSVSLAGSHKAHGAPLGDEEIAKSKKAMGWPENESFVVPEAVTSFFAQKGIAWQKDQDAWDAMFAAYAQEFPEKAAEFKRVNSGVLPENLEAALPVFEAGGSLASRASGGKVINALAAVMPELVGGSADLSPSNNTDIKDGGSIAPGSFEGRILHFGVRENAMGSIMNGMAVYGGFVPFGGTFMVFADYMRPAMRLAALMKQRVIYVLTHDSIFVGEDGPTHQPVEHLASMRCIPNLTVIRPSDANEVAQAWLAAIQNTSGPTALILTRQNLDTIDRTAFASAQGLQKGAYTVSGADISDPDGILVATGSEVGLALDAAKALQATGKKIRVVSMPSWELFDAQDEAYRALVLPKGVKKVVLEAGLSMGWHKYVGQDAGVVCIDHFGASAPYKKLAAVYGLSVENVVKVAAEVGI